MKHLIVTILGILLATYTFAQAPEKFSYQALVRDANNNLIVSSIVGMQITILKDSATGLAVYAETQTPTSDENGLVSLEIGSGTLVSGSFASINWANGAYFIKTETDPTGGTNYSISGTSQLLSVPYVLYAKSAASVSTGTNFTHYIGEQFGGGVIFNLWIDAQGVEHGLIVDLVDLSAGVVWSNVDQTSIGIGDERIWDGLGNSNAIVNQAGHTTSAAALCLNSTNGGYNDWYLPSIQELNILWNNYFDVSKSLSQIAGAALLELDGYWSSTEYGPSEVWYFSMVNSYLNFSNKNYQYTYVRAIRAF